MCPERALKQRNIDNIATSSVTSREIDAQRKELVAAERNLSRMEQKLLVLKDQVDQSILRQKDLRGQYKVKKTKQIRRRLEVANNRLSNLRQRRDSMSPEYRELKLMVRDQRALLKALEKKEIARQAAVARFLKEWERDYDRKMRRKQKNARIRKKIS
jgi:Na+-translocating ferredoxin:NAD+ oxidoreductase RnfC subunit